MVINEISDCSTALDFLMDYPGFKSFFFWINDWMALPNEEMTEDYHYQNVLSLLLQGVIYVRRTCAQVRISAAYVCRYLSGRGASHSLTQGIYEANSAHFEFYLGDEPLLDRLH